VRILYLTDNYVPEIAAPSFRARDHAREWVGQGHEVTVVTCAPNWPHGRVYEGYRNRLWQVETLDGVRVIRLGTYLAANRGFCKRTLDYLSYMVVATFFAWRYPRFDVLVASSPQFFTAVAGWGVALLRRRPWVFEVRDLWPESIKAVGAMKGRTVRWLERLELFLYRRARRVIVVTEGFRDNLVERGVDAEKVDVVTNGVDTGVFDPARADRAAARASLGIADGVFLAGFVGTTGMAQGLETMLEAARLCRDRSDIRWLVMGEGAERAKLEERATELQLTNVQFRDRVPQEQVADYYAALDAGIIHLRPNPIFRAVLPSKLFELMAMGVPIVMGLAGEAARIVERAGCGVCFPSGDATAMYRAVARLADDAAAGSAMGHRGRAAVAERFARKVKAKEALATLLRAAGHEAEATAQSSPSQKLDDNAATAADVASR